MAQGALSGLAGLALALTLLASPAWAQETSSAGLRAELQKLRVLYTEEHPDVQQTKRALERALQLEAERRQRNAAAAPPAPAASEATAPLTPEPSKKGIILPAGMSSHTTAEERKKERKALEEFRKTRKTGQSETGKTN